MSKFASQEFKPTMKAGPVKTTGGAVTNHAGGIGYNREALSDLFVFAACNLVGEDTYYEAKGARDERFRDLVHQATVADPDWVARFVPYLRNSLNMRSASIVVAVESALQRLGRTNRVNLARTRDEEMQITPIRKMIADALQRPDEPAELIAYWRSRTGSRAIPGGVQRGLGDAVCRLFNERAALKYDGVNNAFRMADVVALAKPPVTAEWQRQLFDYLADVRWKRDEVRVGEALTVIKARQAIENVVPEERRNMLLMNPVMIGAAGYTWESLSSLGPMDKKAWEAVIPHMGIMALIRNLRNFDEAKVSDKVAKIVQDKLMDEDVIAKSRQFPYRFLSAYHAAPSLRWAYPLEVAMNHAARNVPGLPGRTLLLVDTSGSMTNKLSERSVVSYADVGALIGATIAARGGQVDLYGFADGVFHHGVDPAAGILKAVTSFQARNGEVGHGTQMLQALQKTFIKDHARVVIVSDMQVFPYLGIGASAYRTWGVHNQLTTVDTIVPESVPVFGLNVAGYAATAIDTSRKNRFELAGFSDKLFTLFGVLSSGQGANWPF